VAIYVYIIPAIQPSTTTYSYNSPSMDAASGTRLWNGFHVIPCVPKAVRFILFFRYPIRQLVVTRKIRPIQEAVTLKTTFYSSVYRKFA